MQKGTFAEFSKSGIDFEGIVLWEKVEKAEPSPGPGTLTLISESSVQSQQSFTPLLKDAAAEDQDVSFSFFNILVCPLLMVVQSSPLMTSLSQNK